MPRPPLIAVATAVALLLAAGGASADTYLVTKRGDPVPGTCKQRDCSLREAVIAANAQAGKDVIELPSRREPYLLRQPGTAEDAGMSGDLDIANDPLVLKHPGRGRATVDANGLDRAFEVFAGAPTTFRKLAITGGHDLAGPEGGGIRADADLKVIGSRVAGNDTAGYGGGIGLQGGAGLELTDSVIAANEARFHGGAIDDDNGAIRIVRSRIVRNTALNDGGGVHLDSAGAALIATSTIAGNEAGSWGGGVFTNTPGTLRIRATTVSRNRAGRDGGGLYVLRPVKLTNSTVATNRASGNGGGIAAVGLDFGAGRTARGGSGLALQALTVARNVADAEQGDGLGGSGGGLFAYFTRLPVENSLLALNRLGSGERNDCDGNQRFDSRGHNLVSTTSAPAGACEGFAGMSGPASDIVGAGNPRIGKLKRNGGPTRTIAVRKRSPAINAANRSTAPKRDQRGQRRGRRKDIGAYERNGAPTPR